MIGAKIKEYLTEHGIKQSYLAEKVGLTNSAMSDICINDRKIECQEYYKICRALNVPYDYFMEED